MKVRANGYDGEIRIGTKIDTKSASSQFLALENRIAKTADKIKTLKDRIDETQSALRMGVGNVTGDDLQKYTSQLSYAESEMRVLCKRHEELASKQEKVGNTGKKSMNEVGKSAKKTGGFLKTLGSRFKGILLSLLIFNWISKGWNAMVAGIRDGMQNLAKYSSEYNHTMSDFTSAMSTLKGTLSAAFEPIANYIIPLLTSLINWLNSAIGTLNQFFAALSGKSTYTKAIKQQKDYAKSLDKTSGSANKAAGALAKFDDLDVLDKSSGGAGAESLFEEAPVDSKVNSFIDKLNPIRDNLKLLKNEVVKGFNDTWSRLNIDSQVDDLKEKFKIIKDSLKDIFSDPEVLEGADECIKAWAYSFGQIAASFINVGLSIAQFIVGGIANYLSENTDRIKKHIISMFDISTDVGELLGNFSEAFAYIFQSFGSESGQNLSANLIGIFADAFMGLEEFCAKAIRDILGVIMQPIISNQSSLKSILISILGVAESVFGSIKSLIDNLMDTINTAYDTYLAPAFDNLKNALSNLIDALSPVIALMAYLWGVVASAIDDIQNSKLLPFLDWIINTFVVLLSGAINVIAFIISGIATVVKTVTLLIMSIVNGFKGEIIPVTTGIIGDIAQKVVSGVNSIKETIVGILDKLKTSWSDSWVGMKTSVLSIFESMWGGIKGIINSIIGGIERMANSVVSGVNKVIDALNSLSGDFDIGGENYHIGFDLNRVGTVSLQRLANGGITTGRTIAEFGEAGREAVLPLENNTDWMQDLASVINQNKGSNQPVYLQVDGVTFAQLFNPFIQQENSRIGVKLSTT